MVFSSFSAFLHSFELVKLASSSIRVKTDVKCRFHMTADVTENMKK